MNKNYLYSYVFNFPHFCKIISLNVFRAQLCIPSIVYLYSNIGQLDQQRGRIYPTTMTTTITTTIKGSHPSSSPKIALSTVNKHCIQQLKYLEGDQS